MGLEPATSTSEVAKRVADKTSVGTIIGAIIAFSIIVLAVPPFLFLLPFVLIGMVVLYMVADNSRQKALRIANSHVRSGESTVFADAAVGTADHVVVNDWGLVYVRARQQAIQIPWSGIDAVREPHLGVLQFDVGSKQYELDLSALGYFQIAEAVQAKIPERAVLLIDLPTGSSKLMNAISQTLFGWKKGNDRFVIDRDGVNFNDKRFRWDEISSVRESVTYVDEAEPVRTLRFSNSGDSFDLDSRALNKRELLPRFTDYDLVRAVVAERVPSYKVSFDLESPPPIPHNRALWEFETLYEAYEAAFSLALKQGRLTYIARRFQHLMNLVEKYQLDSAKVSRFREEYALLQERMGTKV